jgi:hypothetical protein
MDDCSIVNRHGLIGMWGAVEVAIEDTVVLILTKEESALSVVAGAGVKTAKFQPGPVSEEDARYLFARLEKQPRGELKVGEFYIHLLGLFGLRFRCGRHTLSKLEEINSVRNCILHRGGIIDNRAAKVGALRPFLGKQIPITRDRYLEYYDAIGDFLSEMMDGIGRSSYIRTADATGAGDAT